MNLKKELSRQLEAGRFEATDAGILLRGGLLARGKYHVFIDGEHVETTPNKIPAEGLIYLLKTGLLGEAQLTSFYLALFSGAVNPQDNWTAANFSANASEIVSPTEGYSNATRPQWVPDTTTPATPVVGNLASKATYNIVCTSSLNISGAALLSSNVKGGTTGTLISATRFDNVHTVNNGSTFQLGYEVELVDV
jgi:hypothetical protein